MADDDAQSIVITAVSAITAVGFSAKTTCAAIKAGVLPFQEHDYIRCTPEDPDWDEDLIPLVARVPFISAFTNDIERFNAMAIPALTELFSASSLTRKSLAHTGLLVALPQKDPSVTTIGADYSWLPQIRKATGLGGTGLAKAKNNGRIGTFELISEAVGMLRAGELNQCIVGGIDSYLFDHRMAHFDQQWRVKTQRNVDGFIPGEAAAMLMLETRSNAQARGVKPLACINGFGSGVEEVDLTTNRASSGQGLTQAIREALSQCGDINSIESAHCSLNGESYFAYEWGLVQTRLGRQLQNISKLYHPADCVGEVGAAIGALMLVNATSIIEKSKKSESILLFAANDDQRRAALILSTI
jgi:3-oxoacyl-[acyl-carrier-protein] synthase I